MVRNEVDIVGEVVRNLRDQGVDHVVVADHGSTDGTRELLEELSTRDPRIHVADDREPVFYQSEKITYLARRAWRAGADWVIPFDGDEYWFAVGGRSPSCCGPSATTWSSATSTTWSRRAPT